MELTASIQKYAWGKRGNSSLVAQLANSAMGFEPSDSENYAELWIGTHPNGPSTVAETKQSLDQLIKENPAILGNKVVERFGSNLPFLLKVLSVETALSIQAHPNLELASQLHSSHPDIYKDGNHKPEMAIAVTPFEVLCGFRDFKTIVSYLRTIPELRTVVGEEAASQLEENLDKESLKQVFSSLMKSDDKLVASQLQRLLSRLSTSDIDESDLIRRLASQYPDDVGIFCVFFLQHILLQPGDAVFLPANEPHAYIYGDCVECMASSDNVVRAGLTPKFKDVRTLTEMLTYHAGSDWVVRGRKLNESSVLYDPPIPEFAIIKHKVTSRLGLKTKEHTCSVLLCLEGEGTCTPQSKSSPSINIKPGSTIFLPAEQSNSEIEIVSTSDNLTLFEVYATP